MTSYRMIIGVIVGIVLSFFTVFFFNMVNIIDNIALLSGDDPIKLLALLVGVNFDFDIVSFFLGAPNVEKFLAAELLAWIFIGILSGAIAKGFRRGILTSFIVVILVLLIWIILSIFSGVDLMALFQEQLLETLGGIIGGITGAVIGGSIGGAISGPYEEF